MRSLVFGLVIAQISVMAVAVQAENPVGVVTEVKGSAYIKRSGSSSWLPVKVNMPVYAGDMLKTKQGAKVVVWTPSGRAETLGSNKTVSIVHAKNSRNSLWREVWTSFVGRMKRSFSEESLATVAAARSLVYDPEKDRLTLISPRNTKVLDGQPVFVWSDVGNAKGYRVTVGFFEEGNRVWETIVNGTSMRYPENAPELKPNKVYIWQVEAIGVPEAQESAWFVVLNPAEARDIRFTLQQLRSKAPDLVAYSLMAASFLELRGCYSDAISILRAAIKHAPKQPEPRFLLASLYETVGLNSFAVQVRSEARHWLAVARSLGWQIAATR